MFHNIPYANSLYGDEDWIAHIPPTRTNWSTSLGDCHLDAILGDACFALPTCGTALA